jgi:hypothetical protein
MRRERTQLRTSGRGEIGRGGVSQLTFVPQLQWGLGFPSGPAQSLFGSGPGRNLLIAMGLAVGSTLNSSSLTACL